MSLLHRQQLNQREAMETDPDSRLVEWSIQNPLAFSSLYDRYFPAVYGYCLSQLRDQEMAEDATSQTFLKALVALPSYQERGRFRSWLFAIAHNVILDGVYAQHTNDHLAEAQEIPDSTATPEDLAIAALDAACLDAVIDRLPASDRHIMELRRAGLSGKEIAAILGISHEAAKKRQLRAIDRIRADLLASADGLEVLCGA